MFRRNPVSNGIKRVENIFGIFGEYGKKNQRETVPEVLLRCDGGFRHWSSSGELYDAEAEAGQERQ